MADEEIKKKTDLKQLWERLKDYVYSPKIDNSILTRMVEDLGMFIDKSEKPKEETIIII